MKNLWHKPEEKPKNFSRIVFIRKYRRRYYIVGNGDYVKDDTVSEDDLLHEYLSDEEGFRFRWKDNKIYLWCYPYEFSKMIQFTFKKRQRKYHLRNESKRIFS